MHGIWLWDQINSVCLVDTLLQFTTADGRSCIIEKMFAIMTPTCEVASYIVIITDN